MGISAYIPYRFVGVSGDISGHCHVFESFHPDVLATIYIAVFRGIVLSSLFESFYFENGSIA